MRIYTWGSWKTLAAHSLWQSSIWGPQFSPSGHKYIFHVLPHGQWRQVRGRVVSTWQLQGGQSQHTLPPHPPRVTRWPKPARSSTPPSTGHTVRHACSKDQIPHQTQQLEVHGQLSTPAAGGNVPDALAGMVMGHLKSLHGLITGQIDCPLQDLEGGRISFFHHRSHVQTILKKEFRLFET